MNWWVCLGARDLENHGQMKLQRVEFSPAFMCRGKNYCWPLIATLTPLRSHQQALTGKDCVWAGLLLRTTEWIKLCHNFKNKTLPIFCCSLHIVTHLSCWWRKLSISLDWYFARFSPSHSIHKLLISAD